MRSRRNIAMVVPRPKRLLRTRSRICAVSTSGDCARAGRASSGDRPPAHLTRHLLFAVIAYRLQADRLGDLDHATQQVLDRTVAKEAGPAMSARLASFDQKRTELTPGTVLVREWDRRSQRVMVMADGFAWNGQTYDSLSKIAWLSYRLGWLASYSVRLLDGSHGKLAACRRRKLCCRSEAAITDHLLLETYPVAD
jgi:hypothetical protein